MIRILIIYIGVAIAIGWLLRWVWTSPNRTQGYDELLLACSMDRKLAERLIKHELEKQPSISREEAISRAITAFRRDRGA